MFASAVVTAFRISCLAFAFALFLARLVVFLVFVNVIDPFIVDDTCEPHVAPPPLLRPRGLPINCIPLWMRWDGEGGGPI